MVPERRRYPRQRIAFVLYAEVGPGNGGIIHNLSEDGLAITTVGPMVNNQVIRLGFNLEANERIEVTGQVAWTNETRKGAGIKFVDLAERSHEHLKNWLSSSTLTSSVQADSATRSRALGTRQFESSSARPEMTREVADSAKPIVQQTHDSATSTPYAAARASGTTRPIPESPSSDDMQGVQPSYEVSPALRYALSHSEKRPKLKLSEQSTPEQTVGDQPRRRKLIFVSISSFLAVLAVAAVLTLYRSQHGRMAVGLEQIKSMIVGDNGSSDHIQPSQATTHPGKSKITRPRLASKDKPAGQAGYSTRSPTAQPKKFNQPAQRVDTPQIESPSENSQPQLTPSRNVPVVRIKGSVATLEPKVHGKDYEVAAPGNTPGTGMAQEVSGGLPKVQPIPSYPPLAVQENVQGSVILQALIGKDGTVQNARLVKGLPILASAVMEAVKKWRYEPYLLNGEPVEVERVIVVEFTISTR